MNAIFGLFFITWLMLISTMISSDTIKQDFLFVSTQLQGPIEKTEIFIKDKAARPGSSDFVID